MHNFYQLYPSCSIVTYPLVPQETNYLQLIEQYSAQIQQQNLEITELRNENLQLRAQILQGKLHQQDSKIVSDRTITSKDSQSRHKRTKPERTFFCDYENCSRSYSSTLALNLHIKTKHNGGTKKERDAYAKLIILAELRGEPKPEINFTFSENYLKKFKQRLMLEGGVQRNQNDQLQKSLS